MFALRIVTATRRGTRKHRFRLRFRLGLTCAHRRLEVPGRLAGGRRPFPQCVGNRQFQQRTYLLLRSALRRQYPAPKTHNGGQNGDLHHQARQVNPVILEPIYEVVHRFAFAWLIGRITPHDSPRNWLQGQFLASHMFLPCLPPRTVRPPGQSVARASACAPTTPVSNASQARSRATNEDVGTCSRANPGWRAPQLGVARIPGRHPRGNLRAFATVLLW